MQEREQPTASISSTGQATSSTSTIQSIIDAFANYTEVTGIDLSENPFAAAIERSNSPEAILELLQEREKIFKEYRNSNRGLINCLTPAVKVIQAFSGILGEAVTLVPFPPAKALFVGIDILLAAASGVKSSYDALLELFECLGNFLKRLEIYTTIPPSPIMTEIIVKIMVQLLSVLALASKQIKQGRFKKFTKKLLGESEIETVLQRLDRLTQDEARVTVAQTLGIVYGLVGNVKTVMEDGKTSTDSIRQELVSLHRMLNEMNKMKRDQLQWEVQRWLSPPDPSKNHDFVWKAHHTGTSVWFLESKTLAEWKSSGSLLWIHGKPGSGKSTLLSAIIEGIEDMRTAGLATMAYYYFDFRDAKKQDRYGLLSSILSQLSAELDSCYEVVSQLFTNHARGTRKPTTSALTKCARDVLSLPGQGPIYIIVDAVDECPNFPGRPSAREEVLKLIEELADLNLPNLHLCVASRPEMDIRTVFEPLTTLKISLHDESGQKEDIVKYVESVVRSDRSMRRWKEEDKLFVINTLSDKSDGMFRWVVCQVDRLCRTFPASIRSVLEDLPKTLDETYDRTLLGIDEEKREYAQRLFLCLAVSIRPLRVEELAEVLAVRFLKTAPLTFNAAWRPESAEEAVISACSSLISVVDKGGKQVVQFSHFSVKEYLTSERLATADGRLSYYHILPEPAHVTLAHISLSVLLHLDYQIDRDTIRHLPLAPYAARHWVDHAQFANVSFYIKEVMKRLFDTTKPHFAAWVWLYDIDRYWTERMPTMHPVQPEALPLYYASLCGFVGLAEHLIATHSRDINSKGGSHTTPLHAASVKGHFEVASLLLENGADPNARDNLGRVPLHRVPQNGQLAMVESPLEIALLLVNSGADVNVTDIEGRTPLHAAARSGFREIVEVLLISGANIDVPNNYGATPLQIACSDGKLDVSRLLIDRGSDINFPTINGFIPLHTASWYGHVDIARLLLDCGSDVNDCNAAGLTPLHRASYRGHLDFAKLLIDSGGIIDCRDHMHTPLGLALLRGHLHIAKFLLECGANVDFRNRDGQTSLFLASRKGKLDMARFLIEHGTDIYAKDDNGYNPLHIASYHGHPNIVQLLIDSGIPINVSSGDEWVPLAIASIGGNVEVGRLLIERGAELNVRDDWRTAPIHLASQHGHLDMARLLLDHGVDPDIQDDNLWSPLHLASANGRLKVAELLIQRGASVDLCNEMQETPLYQSVWNGKISIVHFLVDHGANLHTADSNGWTLLHAASYCGHLGVVELLLRLGVGVDVLDKASKTAAKLALQNGRVDVAKFIANYKADATIRSNILSIPLDTAQNGAGEYREDDAEDLLRAAASEGDLDAVKSLLERGADVNCRNESDQTPLDGAAEKGNVDVVRLLIEWGAEVDSFDKWGWTPLHSASRLGQVEVSRILLDNGANVNARTLDHSTPLELSARSGELGVVELLIERGADIQAMNDMGETPYQIALQKGFRAIANLLRERGANREK